MAYYGNERWLECFFHERTKLVGPYRINCTSSSCISIKCYGYGYGMVMWTLKCENPSVD